MTHLRPRSALDTLLAEIARAARQPEDLRPAAVAEVIAGLAARPDLLAGREFPCSAQGYVRHLLRSDEGYAVVALVWRPGQMSPVHAHKAWCAFGVHRGVLTESFYAPGDPPIPVSTRLLPPGGTGAGPARPDAIHRLANLGCETAVSIHCYGVAFDRFGTGVNEILAH